MQPAQNVENLFQIELREIIDFVHTKTAENDFEILLQLL